MPVHTNSLSLSLSLPPSLSQGMSDLSALCQIMCAMFADHCPVYSKSAVPPQPSWGQQPIRPPATYATPNPYGARPPYPQYPPQQQQYPGECCIHRVSGFCSRGGKCILSNFKRGAICLQIQGGQPHTKYREG